MLVGALGAGAALLHSQYTNPRPITLHDLAESTDQGTEMAKDAADKAGDVANKVSGAAHTGVQAAKSTAGFIGDTYDAGARLVGELKKSMTSPTSSGSTQARVLVRNAPGTGSSSLKARAGAINALPEDQVLPPAAASEPAAE